VRFQQIPMRTSVVSFILQFEWPITGRVAIEVLDSLDLNLNFGLIKNPSQ